MDGIHLRQVGDEVLLFDRRDDSMHVLNATGAFVWAELERPRSASALADELKRSFEVDASADVVGDLQVLLEDLTARGLVQVDPD